MASPTVPQPKTTEPAGGAGRPDRPAGWMARVLLRSQLVRRLLRRVVWADGTLQLVEEGRNSAAAHQLRWARGREQGSAFTCFPSSPRELTPENFDAHWKVCRCLCWQWFLAQGLGGRVRTILDVGCGGGHITEHFARGGFSVTGVTSNLHERAECLRRGIATLEEDFHFLSVPDGSFDLVFSSHSLEHSILPLFALFEWKRVIRPGGYVMIVLPLPVEEDVRVTFAHHYDPATDALDFAATIGDTLSAESPRTACSAYGVPSHIFVLTHWQLTWLFRLAGLSLIAACTEDPVRHEMYGAEKADGRVPRDPAQALFGYFLLQKPETSPSGADAGTPPPPHESSDSRVSGGGVSSQTTSKVG